MMKPFNNLREAMSEEAQVEAQEKTEKMKCQFDPKIYAGQPIGMFHCPECGDMVLAGVEHPDMDEAEKRYAEYCDEQYEQMKLHFKSYIGESSYESFLLFIDLIPNMKGTMLDLWLRADLNEDYKCMRCNTDVPGRFLYCSPFCTEAHEREQAEESKF